MARRGARRLALIRRIIGSSLGRHAPPRKTGQNLSAKGH